MSKLIVNEIEKYDAGQLTITTGTDVSIGSDLTVGGSIAGTLSTAAQTNITSVGTLSSLAVSGNLTVDTNTLFVDASGNNVGIGTSSPSKKLDVFTNVNASNEYQLSLRNGSSGTGVSTGIAFGFNSTALDPDYLANIFSVITNRTTRSADIIFSTASAATPTERVRVISTGLSFPNGNGIDFSASAGGGATSSLLDDYEEGTWTMGVAFDGASVGATYLNSTGVYTKIGRQVTVNGYLLLSNKGSSTGTAAITGLPFTIPSNTAFYGGATVGYVANLTFSDQLLLLGEQGTATIDLFEATNAGSISHLTNTDFANNTAITISFTYFV